MKVGMLSSMASISHKTPPLFSILSVNSNSLLIQTKHIDYLFHHYRLTPVNCHAKVQIKKSFSTARATQFSTNSGDRKSKKKALRESPEMILRVKLDQCSKNGDFSEALRLYNEARILNVKLNVYHYNVLLYLCSAGSDGNGEDGADLVRLEKGFEIFKQMSIDKVEPNEATFTNASRLAAAKKDPELAFSLIKKMKDQGIGPKLRSYGPALFEFCEKGMADKAYEVDSHMVDNEVLAEEPELSALLAVSSKGKREEKVYELMHRLRATVRQVSKETAATVEDWFKSEMAAEVGVENWDIEKVKKGVVKGGVGWHGQGWLGKGNWRVVRTRMNEDGVCQSCGEKLMCIDIDPKETENYLWLNWPARKKLKLALCNFRYWLYAAVSSKCLLVTNDEMRDHLFNLLGNSFFPRWKEKHQVRLKPSADGISLHMPPP